MKLIKLVIVLAVGIIVLSGCNSGNPQNPEDFKETQKPDNIGTIDKQVNENASIGKIHLGDSQSKVNEILGSVFREEFHEEPGHFPEPWTMRSYDNGIIAIIGKESGQVLELETFSAQFSTDRGIKTGDKAKDAFDLYGSDYQQYESRHGEGKLEGFYDLGDGQLIIFDLDKNDHSLLNSEVKTDSKIEAIRLTKTDFVD